MDEQILIEASMQDMLTRRQMLMISGTFLGGFALGACGRSAPARQTGLRYTVQKGDTLAKLSRRSGLSIQEIVRSNRLRTNVLKIGQVLEFPGVRVLRPDPADVELQETRYDIVSRVEWGALPIKSNFDPMGRINRMTVHHTHEIPGMMHRSDVDIVRAVARYHRNTLQWADIGYHYLIGRDGKVYEGRPATAQGAHARGVNNVSNLGVAVIGDFNDVLSGPKQLKTLELFLKDMRRKYKLSPKRIYGHYQFVNTQCPGKKLKTWLDGFKKRLY
jgi:N-acetylmuramoyl-L-alanine amidase